MISRLLPIRRSWTSLRSIVTFRERTGRKGFRVMSLSDVYVLEEFRGRGLGVWLMECVMSHPDLHGLRRFSLATRDAHGLYQKFGFSELKKPQSQMEIVRNDIYLLPER
jgi:GNAT superfamily N-acetyltransferase